MDGFLFIREHCQNKSHRSANQINEIGERENKNKDSKLDSKEGKRLKKLGGRVKVAL